MNDPHPEAEMIARLMTLPASQRAAALEQVRRENPELGARLSTLIENLPTEDAQNGANLGLAVSNQTAAKALSFALQADAEETSGVRIGPYKLLQKLGEGGFGVVWMAEQHEPIRRRVAVKIIKVGMDTEEVITRFEAERQALALMEHPNIARVFDAGATETGRPYFVMELVRGIAITRYCDENKLSPEGRLRLFITVCQAVQHAHQKGVIHRDLKPSNILVTLHDGVPVPKIIDFGIAKATSARLTEKTLFTQFHTFIGTPAYTSPEQMEMSGLDVDTRSDIYSLGVLLYELLTGQPPFDSEALLKSGLEAMRRTLREVDPLCPSRQLGTLTEVNRTSIAQQRGTDPGKLSLLLRGDLDWIAMRCLEKDRTRRYESAASLAADVERHLSDDVVEARPPSRLYKTRKYIRRHKLAVTAFAAVAASLVAGLTLSSTLFFRERAAHGRAAIAEKKASDLSQKAEAARIQEVSRAGRTSLAIANQNLEEGRVSEGLAYLAYAARKDPKNPTLSPRIASVLASNNFLLPEGAPFECGARVVAMRFAQDGRSFMAGTEDGTLRIFEADTGKLRHEFRLGKNVLAVGGWLFPRGNDQIVGARFTDNTVATYDSETGRALGPAVRLDPDVIPDGETVGSSPDGRWLCAYSYDRFWLWDSRTGELKFESSIEARIQDFDFSADGRYFSLVRGDEVGIWFLADFTRAVTPVTVTRLIPSQKNSAFLSARFSPNSTRLAVLDPYSGIRIWDFTQSPSLGPLLPAEGGFRKNALVFLADGRLLHGGSTYGVWDLESRRLTPLPLPSRGEKWEERSSRDGKILLTISNDQSLHLWKTTTGKTIAHFTQQIETSLTGALHPGGRQVVIGTARGAILRLRAAQDIARPLVLVRPHPSMPLVFLPESPARILWMFPNGARVLDVASGREVAGGYPFPRTLTENAPGEGTGLSPLRDDLKFFVVRNGDGWEAWELSAAGVTRVVPLRDNPLRHGTLSFSRVNDLVAITDRSSWGIWNLRSGARVGPVNQAERPIWNLAVNFSPDGQSIAAGQIWNIASGEPAIGFLEPLANHPLIIRFSTDGTRLLTVERNSAARLWNLKTGKPESPALFHADTIFGAYFSPDDHIFVTRTYSDLRVWNTQSATIIGRPIPLASGRSVHFSADSRRLLTISEDGNARIFDLQTAQPLTEPLDHGGARLPMGTLNRDGLFARIDAVPGDVRIWSIPPTLPAGAPPPEWLLRLATVFGGKEVDDEGNLVALNTTGAQIDSLRAEIAALPAEAPLADWGKWIVNDRPDRSIAPGFTITPFEADKLTESIQVDPRPNP